MTDHLLLIPADAANKIRDGGAWGNITVRISDPDSVVAIVAVSQGNSAMLPVDLTPTTHFLRTADSAPVGRWYRVDADLNVMWLQTRARASTCLPVTVLEDAVSTGLYRGPHFAVTYAPDAADRFPGVPVPDLAAWYVAEGSMWPAAAAVEPATLGMRQLEPAWPADALASTTAMVVGTGSIGGAAAVALATYGVGTLLLVDDDRLLWHNLVRHVGSGRDVGKYKVDALAAQVAELRPDTVAEPHRLNVVTDADQIRSLLTRTTIVVCAADGVAPRRVVSHLARRAQVPAILACVLDDGAVGEVLRLMPWPHHGCLLCHREHLVAAGAVDPEPSLDGDYPTGSRHRPMTAVGGDLHLVGQAAAKAAVATVLERNGHTDQHLPGEHAVLALRPSPNRPAPFDVANASDIRWHPAWPPLADCPTCADA